MNSFIIILLFCITIESINAASQQKLRHEDARTITLNHVIETSKSSNIETDRHMHLSWDEFRDLKNTYDSKFDELICTDPDQLRAMHADLDRLSKEVELGWTLKQEQLGDLVGILHRENYTVTGLSTGNDGVDSLCEGLQEYIDKVNQTAWEDERPELDEHLEEVIQIEIDIETHPCPCVWGSWTQWSDCSTTCEAGRRSRDREIEKEAINNGTECTGDAVEAEVCNEEVCCPVDCVWSRWSNWNPCPSGCNKEKVRTRRRAVVADCGGTDCSGDDFHYEDCSRERELEDEVTRLKHELDTCSVEQSATFPASVPPPNASCLARCGNKPGRCPGYCGTAGYCCKVGEILNGCDGWIGGELIHTCAEYTYA